MRFMRARRALVIVGVALLGQIPYGLGMGPLCLTAQQQVAAQERQTPEGEWCQRPAPKISKQAHPCACHSHDCKADQRDPNNLSAHTDAQCLNFCHTGKCLCAAMDCP